ncbi:MAG: fused MFS/spermidine synthase [Actinomycetota bacterium]|nr:fused MFS/spermidine synthase [Actinomycetota bacterium]
MTGDSGTFRDQRQEARGTGSGDVPPPHAPALPSWLATALVFLSSAAVLVLEILSLRLVAPYVGVTLQTSTGVIGAALAAIAFGAWTGGRVADVTDPRRLLAPALLLAGVATLLVLPVVRWAGSVLTGPDAGSVFLLATLAVFVPAALLASVTPLVVKLELADLSRTGSVVGYFSGVGTLGAIVATFLTGFVLVAALSTSVIVLSLGGLLVAAGLAVAVVLRRGRDPMTTSCVAAAVLCGSLTAFAPDPCERETAYHCARVVPDPSRPAGRTLQLDTLRHSYVDLADPTHLEFGYVRALASVADVFRRPGEPIEALHLGGGGMTFPRYLAASRPGTSSRVLEIDAGVVEVGRRELGLRTGDDLHVDVVDARVGLAAEAGGRYDLVVGDAFGGIAVPWHLTTVETARDVARVLRPDGVYAVNVIDYPPSAFASAEAATLRRVFPHLTVVARDSAITGHDGGNFLLLASRAPLPVDAIAARLAERDAELRVAKPAEVARFVAGAAVLTDDHAPVDQLLNPYG